MECPVSRKYYTIKMANVEPTFKLNELKDQ